MNLYQLPQDLQELEEQFPKTIAYLKKKEISAMKWHASILTITEGYRYIGNKRKPKKLKYDYFDLVQLEKSFN